MPVPDIVWDVARRALAGADLTVATGHGPLAWHVPDANQCKACHLGPDKTMVPIGPKLRNLNVGEQLAALAAAGVVVAAPAGLAASPDYRDAGLAMQGWRWRSGRGSVWMRTAAIAMHRAIRRTRPGCA